MTDSEYGRSACERYVPAPGMLGGPCLTCGVPQPMHSDRTAGILVGGDWIMTRSGAKFYPMAPLAADVRLEDVAHALALTNRFCGHTRFPYSVAQHSIYVSQEMAKLHGTLGALVGLLHDGSEAYLCDLPRPVKKSVAGYAAAEAAVQAVVYRALGVSGLIQPVLLESLQRVDRRMLRTEQRDLMPPPAEGEDRRDAEPFPLVVMEWHWQRARDAFVYRHQQLTRGLVAEADDFPRHETIGDM